MYDYSLCLFQSKSTVKGYGVRCNNRRHFDVWQACACTSLVLQLFLCMCVKTKLNARHFPSFCCNYFCRVSSEVCVLLTHTHTLARMHTCRKQLRNVITCISVTDRGASESAYSRLICIYFVTASECKSLYPLSKHTQVVNRGSQCNARRCPDINRYVACSE